MGTVAIKQHPTVAHPALPNLEKKLVRPPLIEQIEPREINLVRRGIKRPPSDARPPQTTKLLPETTAKTVTEDAPSGDRTIDPRELKLARGGI